MKPPKCSHHCRARTSFEGNQDCPARCCTSSEPHRPLRFCTTENPPTGDQKRLRSRLGHQRRHERRRRRRPRQLRRRRQRRQRRRRRARGQVNVRGAGQVCWCFGATDHNVSFGHADGVRTAVGRRTVLAHKVVAAAKGVARLDFLRARASAGRGEFRLHRRNQLAEVLAVGHRVGDGRSGDAKVGNVNLGRDALLVPQRTVDRREWRRRRRRRHLGRRRGRRRRVEDAGPLLVHVRSLLDVFLRPSVVRVVEHAGVAIPRDARAPLRLAANVGARLER